MTHAWLSEAACHDMPVETFFPETVRGARPDWTEAREVCSLCTVVAACRDYAIAGRIREGMYGGLTPDERLRSSRTAATVRA